MKTNLNSMSATLSTSPVLVNIQPCIVDHRNATTARLIGKIESHAYARNFTILSIKKPVRLE